MEQGLGPEGGKIAILEFCNLAFQISLLFSLLSAGFRIINETVNQQQQHAIIILVFILELQEDKLESFCPPPSTVVGYHTNVI